MREILNTVSRKSIRHLNFPHKVLNKARLVIQNSGSLRFGEKPVGSGFVGLGQVVSIRLNSCEGISKGSLAYSTTEPALITYHLSLITVYWIKKGTA
jgi:hypothetical protein